MFDEYELERIVNAYNDLKRKYDALVKDYDALLTSRSFSDETIGEDYPGFYGC